MSLKLLQLGISWQLCLISILKLLLVLYYALLRFQLEHASNTWLMHMHDMVTIDTIVFEIVGGEGVNPPPPEGR